MSRSPSPSRSTGSAVFGQHVLGPARIGKRIAADREKRDRLRFLRGARGILRSLVSRNDLEGAVAVEILEEHANERAAIGGRGRDDPRPVRLPRTGGRIFEVDQVCELACGNDIEKTVAVDIPYSDVFGGAGFGTLGKRYELPSVGIGAAVGNANMPFGNSVVLIVGFVYRDDVQEAVAIEIGYDEAVAAPELNAADRFVVDEMLTPGDVLAVRGSSCRELPSEGLSDAPGAGLILVRACAAADDYCR
jgi:hypothetical protein